MAKKSSDEEELFRGHTAAEKLRQAAAREKRREQRAEFWSRNKPKK